MLALTQVAIFLLQDNTIISMFQHDGKQGSVWPFRFDVAVRTSVKY
jgi:hypothetical protein